MLSVTLHERDIRRAVGLPEEGDRVVNAVATLREDLDNALFFVDGSSSTTMGPLMESRKGCIVLAQTGAANGGAWGDCIVLEQRDPRAAMSRVLEFIRTEGLLSPTVAQRTIAQSAQVSPHAVIDGNVEIGEGVLIEPFCMIGPDVKIGSGSIIRSGVRLFPRVVIGEQSIIFPNTVVGHEGYGFVRDADGNKRKIPHLAGVRIGSHVEIGVLAVVQAGVLTPTEIEDYARLGDKVTLAHGVRIGRGASLTGEVVVGGSAVVEQEAWIGMHATIREGCIIGAHSLIGMDASVQNDMPAGSRALAASAKVIPRKKYDPTAIGFPRNRR